MKYLECQCQVTRVEDDCRSVLSKADTEALSMHIWTRDIATNK